MARKPSEIDKFAEILIKTLPNDRPCFDERGYVKVASRQIHRLMADYYRGTGVEPPSVDSIRIWFYSGCPDWAIAVMANTLNQKSAA